MNINIYVKCISILIPKHLLMISQKYILTEAFVNIYF